MKPWEEFRRYRSAPDFWGCVDAEGKWFDSSELYEIAIHWCCYYNGQFDLDTEGEREWFQTEGNRLGLSIIHSTMLKQMYEKGLIK